MKTLIALLLAVTFAPASDWPQVGRDSRRLNSCMDSINPAKTRKIFGINLGARITAGPVVRGDTLYVGTHGGKFFAINGTTGAILWQYPATGSIGRIQGGAAVADSLVFVATESCTLYALNLNGTPAWKQALGAAVISDINYNPYRKALYVTDRKGFLHCFSTSGQKRWSYLDTTYTYPGHAGLNYGTASDSAFIALSTADGIMHGLTDSGNSCGLFSVRTFPANNWRHPLICGPVVFGDRIISNFGDVEGLSGIDVLSKQTGAKVGYIQYGQKSYASPAVDEATSVAYAIMTHFGYYAFNLSTLTWKWNSGVFRDRISTSGPVLSRDHIISYTRDGFLEFRAKSNNAVAGAIEVAAGFELKGSWSRPAIANGRIFFGTDHHYLYGYGDGPGTGIQTSAGKPDLEYRLTVAPNPFGPTLTLHFELVEAGKTCLRLFDISGRLVATPFKGRRSAGSHSVSWNTKGKPLAPGTYMVEMTSGKERLTVPITLSR